MTQLLDLEISNRSFLSCISELTNLTRLAFSDIAPDIEYGYPLSFVRVITNLGEPLQGNLLLFLLWQHMTIYGCLHAACILCQLCYRKDTPVKTDERRSRVSGTLLCQSCNQVCVFWTNSFVVLAIALQEYVQFLLLYSSLKWSNLAFCSSFLQGFHCVHICIYHIVLDPQTQWHMKYWGACMQ